MATIKFKGHGTVETDFTNAQNIQSKWETWLQSNRRSDSLVKVGNFAGRLSQIESISLKGEAHAKDQGELVKKANQEYAVDREAKLKLSPAERGKEVGMFKLLYYAATGQEASENEVKIVEEYQTKYFEKFPNRTIVNPKIFFGTIIPRTNRHLNAFESQAFGLVERAVRQDISSAK